MSRAGEALLSVRTGVACRPGTTVSTDRCTIQKALPSVQTGVPYKRHHRQYGPVYHTKGIVVSTDWCTIQKPQPSVRTGVPCKRHCANRLHQSQVRIRHGRDTSSGTTSLSLTLQRVPHYRLTPDSPRNSRCRVTVLHRTRPHTEAQSSLETLSQARDALHWVLPLTQRSFEPGTKVKRFCEKRPENRGEVFSVLGQVNQKSSKQLQSHEDQCVFHDDSDGAFASADCRPPVSVDC